ncbi:hypothetical protein BO94DRAFT_627401 [Aspergillus sclerotioniger CBS 115572]|uniref:Uncharacterized protein n=1 Tax=Aspergillus sclerotioniger CBS 115572 TaxID=1450535 RepID=A0A317VMU4_9EURO|nr:hypothetical protein BO94DRAFT_627401 [Aspergillus sclerotioniger CBS 115572]PWY74561.1 hypothetical protein BO94DRAFT_627401 [Aspergillus sclerotioniger CBS 115572]
MGLMKVDSLLMEDWFGSGQSNHTAQDRQSNVAPRQGGGRRSVPQILNDFEVLSRDLPILRRAWVRKQDIIASLQEQLRQSEQRNQHLEEQLQDCQARILKFSPVSCLSDTTVSEEFIKIRENLCKWAEELPDICGDFKMELLVALDDFESHPLILGWPDSYYPQRCIALQSEILMHLVFRHLWRGIFEVPIPGLSSSGEKLLADLQEGMLSLQPKKDTESIGAWRSDTMRAYAACQKYQQGVNSECSRVIANLLGFFSWFGFENQVNWSNKLSRFSEEILGPATSLATNMSSSPRQYRWEWYGEAFFPRGVVRKRHLKQFIVQDARTHHRVSIANLKFLSDETPVGELLIIIFPALFRYGGGGSEEFLIEKGVILISVNDNLQGGKVV